MKRLLFTLMLCMAGLTAAAQTHTLNYWFDGKYASHTTLTSTTGVWNAEVDVAALRPGFHTLYLRIGNGLNTQQNSYLFYKHPTADTTVQGYRYWFDGNYASRVSGRTTGDILVDVSALRDGFHYMYMYLNNGSESELRSTLFYKMPVDQGADSVVTYWFDGADSTMTTQPIGDGLVMFDVAHLTDTMHTVYLVVGRGRMAQLQTYEFQKVPVVYTVALASADSTRGSVSGAGDYPRNSTVSISATAEYGYHFSMWSDGNTNSLRNIMLTQDTALTAYFVPDTFLFDIAIGDTTMGTVLIVGTSEYLGTDTVTAVPNYGYHFTGWSDGDTTNPRLVTLTQDTALTALFAPNIYTITLSTDTPEWGSVVGTGEYPYLATIPLEAVASYGYQFKQWSDGITQNPRQLVVRGDTTLTATFELLRYHLTVVSNDLSRGFTQGGGTFTVMDTATALAITLAGNSFLGWADGDMTNPRQLQLSSDTTLTAIFQALDSIPETIIVHDTSYIHVHDTTYINVPVHDTSYVDVYVHDTTVVTDTVTLTQVVTVHDTTVVVDTLTLTEYVNVHDTTVLIDTVIVNNYIHDTGIVVIVDTLLVDNYIYDTVTLTEYVYDTVINIVHDTVDNYIYDTTVVVDTLTLTEYVNVHDTTVVVDTVIVNNYIHDTGTVVIIDTLLVDNYIYDTVTLTEYVPVHDTTILTLTDTIISIVYDTVDNYVYDTTVVVDTITLTEYVQVHDTTFINVHDTTYIDVPYAVHDTTIVTLTDTVVSIVYDTVVNTIYDTTIVTDTVTFTEYVQVHDTTIVTVTDTVVNTVYDTVTNTVYDTVTNTLYDTVDNYIYDTTIVTDTLWLTLYDTVYITDTIIIHDTIYVPQDGIDDVATANIRLYQRNGSIVVEDADGGMLPEVRVYDAVGRLMSGKMNTESGKVEMPVPASGVYLVKIGDRPARRVVVIR